MPATPEPDDAPLHQDRLWRDKGWTARVVKNEDDDGWAVEMVWRGEPEPALVGPWTMGRDKKNPKPLDVSAFNTLVKTAAEVVRRHEQHLHALHHRKVSVGGRAAGASARSAGLPARFGQRPGLGRGRLSQAAMTARSPQRRVDATIPATMSANASA